MSIDIEAKLTHRIKKHGDIDEHLICLMKLASECESILECGVRGVVSSWAFINGLTVNKLPRKVFYCCDIERSGDIDELAAACEQNSIEFRFYEENDLNIPMQPYDMIFIDTWHIYGQLKRELEMMHSYAKKYIIMHDTEVDEVLGESIRCGLDIQAQALASGYPVEEIRCGLGKALEEFLEYHPEWRIKKHYEHENGLTILERVVAQAAPENILLN